MALKHLSNQVQAISDQKCIYMCSLMPTYVSLLHGHLHPWSPFRHNSNMTTNFISFPRTIMAFSSICFASAAYLADWSHTHVLNPRWPPHAKFHNGQTMSVGAINAALVVYLLSRRTKSSEMESNLMLVAAIVGSSTALAGLSAILYPGTASDSTASLCFRWTFNFHVGGIYVGNF
jgi:hypothetical protein